MASGRVRSATCSTHFCRVASFVVIVVFLAIDVSKGGHYNRIALAIAFSRLPNPGFGLAKRVIAADREPCNLSTVTDLVDFFGEQSPLRELLPGFQPRAGQAWMAEAVAEAIAGLDKLVVEAGTGTGKTFAYLLPALLSGRKTIISTGTKALQDQLYHRDLPLIGKAVGRPCDDCPAERPRQLPLRAPPRPG